MSGGVASNQYVRARLNQVVQNNDLELVCPPPSLCTDNGKYIFYLDGQTIEKMAHVSRMQSKNVIMKNKSFNWYRFRTRKKRIT